MSLSYQREIISPTNVVVVQKKEGPRPVSHDPMPYLYYLLRGCRSSAEYLKDQLLFLSHTFSKCSSVKDDRFNVSAHSLDRQLTFLQLTMARIDKDLTDYATILKDTPKAVEGEVREVLKQEGERIYRELLDFQDIVTFTKKSIYILHRQNPWVS